MKARFRGVAACAALIVIFHGSPALAQENARWVATWTTSPTEATDSEELIHWNQANPQKEWSEASLLRGTLRYRLRIAKGGKELRVSLANSYERAMLRIEGMSVGVAAKGFDADPATLEEVRFNRESGMTLPAGTRAISDPVDLPVKDGEDLIVSVYIPDGIFLLTYPPQPHFSLVDVAAGPHQQVTGPVRVS